MSVAAAQLGIMEGSSYITSGILVCLLVFTLLRVWNGSRVDFLLILVFMLLVSNIFFICYIAAYNDRKRLV